MDTKTEIKNSLISSIQNSRDLNLLKALQTIMESTEESLYKLTPEQQNSIEISRSEIKNGKYVKNDEFLTEMKKWLAR